MPRLSSYLRSSPVPGSGSCLSITITLKGFGKESRGPGPILSLDWGPLPAGLSLDELMLDLSEELVQWGTDRGLGKGLKQPPEAP